jgi:hypothetical protein
MKVISVVYCNINSEGLFCTNRVRVGRPLPQTDLATTTSQGVSRTNAVELYCTCYPNPRREQVLEAGALKRLAQNQF